MTAEPVVTGFAIANMDCPSEEAQIRERLRRIDGIRGMTFDLARRHLEVTHEAAGQNAILRALHDIGMHAAVQAAPQQVVYFIQEMDCPSEERQLRAALEPLAGVRAVDFDLKAHTLTVTHSLTDTAPIARTIESLGMKPVENPVDGVPAAAEGLAISDVASPVAAPATGDATRFFISNMDCPTEEATIRKRLGAVEGIERLDFDLMGRRLDVRHHLPDPAPILKALNDVGMKASIERGSDTGPQGQAVYLIEKMDCPTEEGLLRKALEGMPGVKALDFNLMGRTLTVSHELADLASVTAAIGRLGMAPVLQSTTDPASSGTREFGAGISRGQWVRMVMAGVLALGAEALVFAGVPEASWPIILACLAAIGLGGGWRPSRKAGLRSRRAR